MDFAQFFADHKKLIISSVIGIAFFASAYSYVQSVSEKSDIYNAEKVISSNVSFDEKVDFDDVYNKHSFDKDSTDNAAKRIKESFLEQERKKIEEQRKLEIRQQFVIDSIKQASDRIAEEFKQKERDALLARNKRRRKPRKIVKKVTQAPIKKVEKKVLDDDGFLTDFGDMSQAGGLESDITNEVSSSALKSDSKTLYWVNFSIAKSQTVKSGTIVMFENQEDLKLGSVVIPAFSKLQTRVSLSSNRCKFTLQKILTEKAVYNVSGEIYDHNRTPGVAVNLKSDDNALLDGVTSLGKSVLAQSDPTNLANDAIDVTVGSSSGSKYAKLNQNLEVLVNLTIK
jgi:hypothetical protein